MASCSLGDVLSEIRLTGGERLLMGIFSPASWVRVQCPPPRLLPQLLSLCPHPDSHTQSHSWSDWLTRQHVDLGQHSKQCRKVGQTAKCGCFPPLAPSTAPSFLCAFQRWPVPAQPCASSHRWQHPRHSAGHLTSGADPHGHCEERAVQLQDVPSRDSGGLSSQDPRD